MTEPVQGSAALDAQEGEMTTATIEVDDDEDVVEGTPRRILLITVAVLLPTDFEEADIADIVPTAVNVTGFADMWLSNLIETKVQEAHLVMT